MTPRKSAFHADEDTVTDREARPSHQAFFAYPAGHPIISDAIKGAAHLAKHRKTSIVPWEMMKVIGFKIDDRVREQIRAADVLFADITYANPNVLYELGYAIGLGKPVVPTMHSAVESATTSAQSLGLLDTVGWAHYQNATELAKIVGEWDGHCWASNYIRKRDHSQPLFVLDTLLKTDFRNWIFSTIDNSGVRFRAFDPTEVARLPALKAIAEVSSSAGVILPLLSPEIKDAERNNLRSAFMLGLSHGYNVEVMMIQYGNGPAPLDYRDFITNSTYRRETERHVSEFASQVLVWNQRESSRDRTASLGILGRIDLGSSTAEYETQKLERYFIHTAEYARALRAEGALVIGRKGSGKSAIQMQVAHATSRDRRNCVVDLRPASHNLSEMREALLSVVSAGVFDHTIAAFWQYIVYFEILLKLREQALRKARNDMTLQKRLSDLELNFQLTEAVVSGDFTSRLEQAVGRVISIAQEARSAEELKSRLTNHMFESPIPQLRDAVIALSEFAEEIFVFVDDLDKGWPARKVEPLDVSTVRHLIETLNRIKRDLGKRGLEIRHSVFLRSDVYELLVEQTSDRGKYNPIRVDWSDPVQLRHLLRQRVVSGIEPIDGEAAWEAMNPQLESGGDAVDAMIASSLRRPRFLIDSCERMLSFAINRGHSFVDAQDLEDGLKEMSLYLVSDFAYEMRDAAGTPENLFYRFIGCSDLLTETELYSYLKDDLLGLELPEMVDLLLWYGFLGIVNANSEVIFIYDRSYDFRRLEAERPSDKSNVLYAVNPAFLRGLQRPRGSS